MTKPWRCMNCAEYTELLRTLIDATDARGARGCTIVATEVTWNLAPWRSDQHSRVETAPIPDPTGAPITAPALVSERFSETEMFLRALAGTGGDSFHFHAPVSPRLLSRWRRERLPADFDDRVEVHIEWRPQLRVALRRKARVRALPLLGLTGSHRVPHAVRRNRRPWVRAERRRLLRAS